MRSPDANAQKAVVEEKTDFVYDGLTFTKKGTNKLTWYGMPSFGNGLVKWWKQLQAFLSFITSQEKHQVVVMDARKRALDYKTCGFTLRPFKCKVTDWAQATFSESEQQKILFKQLEAEVRKLHPDVHKVEIGGVLLRGGAGSNPPATNGLHLDYYPDWERHREYRGDEKVEDKSGLEMRIVLGLWMPREMANPVYDYPLLIGDASTFTSEDVVPMEQQFTEIAEGGKIRNVRNLAAGAPVFADRQRWYYYHEQTCEELVIFRHLTAPPGGKACFHGAIQQPLPEGKETRKSVESRAFLYFKK